MNKPKEEGGERVSRRWWYQKGIDWDKAKARAAETDSETKSDAEVEVQADPEEKE